MPNLSINFITDLVSKKATKKFASDKTFKEKLEIWLVKDHRKAFYIRIFNMMIKLAICILYIVRIQLTTLGEEINHEKMNHSNHKENFDLMKLAYVNRHPIIRYMQIVLAAYGFIEAFVYFHCLNYNGKIYFFIEMLCTVPWIFEITIPGAKDMFIPVFLNCWLLKRHLDYMFKHYNYLNMDNSLILQKEIALLSFLCCLVFTCLCGIQHIQRASPNQQFSLIEAFYFTIITLSTVGYGDLVADYWLSRLFIAVVIIVAIVVIPSKIETIASLWYEWKRSGGTYHSGNGHIVVCLNYLEYGFIEHFLKEFYGHRRNQPLHTVILSNCELNSEVKQLLNSPLWYKRVYFILGSAMREHDLERCRVTQAQAAFILSPKGLVDKDKEDQHTILRSWAIKDFAPHVPQFVQLFRTENKMHLSYVENLVCEDEFKYAILANNCLCPGISTLITLMLHKSAFFCSDKSNLEPWQSIYGSLAGNEIHSIIASGSKFFQEYIGKPFPLVSLTAHEKYNINLVAICTKLTNGKKVFELPHDKKQIDPDNDHSYYSKVLINPGTEYLLQPDDICIYIAIVKEQDYDWTNAKTHIVSVADKTVGSALTQHLPPGWDRHWDRLDSKYNEKEKYSQESQATMLTTDSEEATIQSKMSHYDTVRNDNAFKIVHQLSIDYSCLNSDSKIQFPSDVNDNDLVIDRPPNPSSFGTFQTQCKLLKTPKDICCMNLGVKCEHRMNVIKTSDYTWHNKCIILCAEHATNGLFNFLLPLRAKARSTTRMKPIVLLLQNRPSSEFLETIASFPLIFWMEGSISDVSTLLKAGILHSEALVVVSNENHFQVEDESLYDSSNIFAIQNIFRLFPRIKIISELRKASNISFLKFRVKDMEKDKLPKLRYMFRLPFAGGYVFSASMIDTLLYQAFGKSYLIEFIRLLIGISQSDGSGNLTSILLNKQDLWVKTYGNFYRHLSLSTGEIPIGIYRTNEKGTVKEFRTQNCDLRRIVLSKMEKLKMNSTLYDNLAGVSTVGKTSYVLINPSSDLELQQNDIIYLLKPGNITF